MCGIAGIVTKDEALARRALPRMVAALAHRGPNDSGAVYLAAGGGIVGLGHTRLSILDLSASGHQPMVDPATGNWLVFNGEIYNYLALKRALESAGTVFHGSSDSEVLLQVLGQSGELALPQLEGMFAFAFFDARRQRLMLARDPLGIKPLYFGTSTKSFVFSSESRTILTSGAIEPTLDQAAIVGYLGYGAVQDPSTIFANIRAFPRGTWQWFEFPADVTIAGGAPRRFWSIPAPRNDVDSAQAVVAIRGTLDHAIQSHLMSDVPVGVFLSSGIDSTIIAGLAAQHNTNINCFTVSFTEAFHDDEAALARATAGRFGLPHQAIRISEADALRDCSQWLSGQDQPSIDGLNTFILSKALRSHGIAVALSGLGADELWGGYPAFKQVPGLMRWLRLAHLLPLPVLEKLISSLSLVLPSYKIEKLRDLSLVDLDLLNLYLARRRLNSTQHLRDLGFSSVTRNSTALLADAALAEVTTNTLDPVWSISQFEALLYMGNTLLRDSDSNSMAHSLELRVPMLDQRMLNLAFALPGRLRMPAGGKRKALLHAAFPDLLTPAQSPRRKRGFSLPLAKWMQGPLRNLCEQGLRSLKESGVVEPLGVDKVWQAFLKEPHTSIWTRAFSLCVLGHCLGRKVG